MKKLLLLALVVLALPAVALAKPPHPSAPQVTYKLKGTLSNYLAYDAATSTNGSITILVKRARPHAKSLKGATLTFVVDANTKFRFADHVTAFANGDRGMVRVRAARKIPAADLATTLQASPAKRIVDKGVKK